MELNKNIAADGSTIKFLNVTIMQVNLFLDIKRSFN